MVVKNALTTLNSSVFSTRVRVLGIVMNVRNEKLVVPSDGKMVIPT